LKNKLQTHILKIIHDLESDFLKYILTFIITCFATLMFIPNKFAYIVDSKLTTMYTDLDAYFGRSYNCSNNTIADRAKLIHNKAGFTMLVDACDNVVSRYNSLPNGWEPHVTKAIKLFTKHGDNALVLGAHIGTHVLNFSKAVGETGHVYAVDPEPLMYNFTKINLMINNIKNTQVYNYAAYDQNTLLQFSSKTNGESNTGGSHIAWDDDLENNEHRILVKAKKIDVILNFVNKLDIILMDIEGAEPRAIEGMSALLERSSNPIIIQEWGVDFIKKLQRDPRKYLESFAKKNYSFAKFQDNKLVKVEIDDLLQSKLTDIVMSTDIDNLIKNYNYN
jgi:FkbM family methyltransferase